MIRILAIWTHLEVVRSSTPKAMTETARRRKKHARSAAGCGICRARHVRCDETRPSCNECVRTGRHCDGYSSSRIPNGPSNSLDRPVRSVLPLIHHTGTALLALSKNMEPSAQRALQYFQFETAEQFSGCFQDEFWTTLVLQISQQEDCVCHALIALATLHEHFRDKHSSLPKTIVQSSAARETGIDLPQRQQYDRAAKHYTKAIGLLQSHIFSKGFDNLEVTLLCCLLCAGFEILRGFYNAAQTHIQGGITIIAKWQSQESGIRGTSPSSPKGYLVRRTLAPMFSRLAMQATLFSDVQPTCSKNHSSLISCTADLGERGHRFESLTLARDAIHSLLWQIFFLPTRGHLKTNIKSNRSRNKRRADFAMRLDEWYAALTGYLNTVKTQEYIGGDRGKRRAATSSLMLYYKAARVMISTCLQDDEMMFDDFEDDFRHIVNEAEDLLLPLAYQSLSTEQCQRYQAKVSHFSLESGIVPVLYYVALKCRVPQIRYRALALMSDTPNRREGVWESAAAALVAGQIVEIEERRREGNELPVSARVDVIRVRVYLENRNLVLQCGRRGKEDCKIKRQLWW
ncbi:hypothetical protein JX265_009101 [Neoarthrinium moseri]|uniref:Zn(2)-C6 fungal-type domain-containing protein n=1 Tax=Neoarthrinium moseri TaxID=1658444 RepID=A0A9P9WHA2_9PEZI|nr:hypothetical protein JX265_009101 [Neoarthrinium moseri]